MLSDAEALTIPRSSPGNHAPRSMAIPTAAAFTQTDPPCSTTEVSCCTSPIPRLLNESKGMESSVVQDKLWEIEMLQRQLIELRLALDRERRVRLMLEDQMRITELNRLQVCSPEYNFADPVISNFRFISDISTLANGAIGRVWRASNAG